MPARAHQDLEEERQPPEEAALKRPGLPPETANQDLSPIGFQQGHFFSCGFILASASMFRFILFFSRKARCSASLAQMMLVQ
mmetsp:Transcript_28512/g.45786  ORF Transcript_28512/g.45786 Transcript_28512/m.45786 type:complete len:82 (-) Transcript_28512:29-274(-)